MKPRIVGLWRYPVKGLGGESLNAIEVTRAAGAIGDRRFALAHDGSGYDPAAPGWRKKKEFLQLAQDPGLASLSAALEPVSGRITLAAGFGRGAQAVGRPAVPEERRRLEQFIADHAVGRRRPGARLVEAEDTIFSDTGAAIVSIISLGSVREIARTAGVPVDPRRFRGNLVIDEVEPWAEFGWIGRSLWAGSVSLTPVERIGRCSATCINPETGDHDIEMVRLLRERFGHTDCGVYAEIAAGGRLSIGNSID
jgi:uncharacterized protein YcbX